MLFREGVRIKINDHLHGQIYFNGGKQMKEEWTIVEEGKKEHVFILIDEEV